MAFSINENCSGCTTCANICPVFAITGEKNAQHVINKKRCVECGVCGRICQKSAIIDSAGKTCTPIKRALWPKPVIKITACHACSICVHDCTSGALRISMPQFKGDIKVYSELAHPQKCTGCSICKSHCPVGAITMEAEK